MTDPVLHLSCAHCDCIILPKEKHWSGIPHIGILCPPCHVVWQSHPQHADKVIEDQGMIDMDESSLLDRTGIMLLSKPSAADSVTTERGTVMFDGTESEDDMVRKLGSVGFTKHSDVWRYKR